MCKLAKYVRNCIGFGKIYTADKNFTRPPVATVATNFKSAAEDVLVIVIVRALSERRGGQMNHIVNVTTLPCVLLFYVHFTFKHYPRDEPFLQCTYFVAMTKWVWPLL